MPTRKKQPKKLRTTTDVAEHVRENQKRELKKAVRRERDVRKLATLLEKEMGKTNDRLQQIMITLGSFSRAIDAERETSRAVNG